MLFRFSQLLETVTKVTGPGQIISSFSLSEKLKIVTLGGPGCILTGSSNSKQIDYILLLIIMREVCQAFNTGLCLQVISPLHHKPLYRR